MSPTETRTELVVFSPIEAAIAEAKIENEKLIFDYNTPQGEKDARSHIAQLRKIKTKISDIHKEAKADALAFSRRLDGKKNELIGEVEGMIKVHKDPLDAIEAERQAVIDAEKRKAEEEEAKRIAELEARERAVREAEEKQAREKAEKERIEREKRIAEEAAERARKEAEERLKAEAAAKELAERRRKEAEEEKERKRIENKKHREKIEGEIENTLISVLGFDSTQATWILEILKENRIPHVSINY